MSNKGTLTYVSYMWGDHIYNLSSKATHLSEKELVVLGQQACKNPVPGNLHYVKEMNMHVRTKINISFAHNRHFLNEQPY